MSTSQAPWKVIGILAVTQVTSWGSLFYAFSVLAPEIQRELGWRSEVVFGAFSLALLVAGVTSTPAGVFLDRHGGRRVMGTGSLVSGIGLITLSFAQSIPMYFLAWAVLGVAMALVLYEAAFATISREILENPRKSISTLTLFGGLASTVFWPITLKLNALLGWRDTYLVFGVAQLLLCAPLHSLLVARKRQWTKPVAKANTDSNDHTLHDALRNPTFWKLAFAFAANAFVFSALSIHLIPLLTRMGHSTATVVLFTAAIGPMQVTGRILEMMFASKTTPQTVGKITFTLLPAALLTLLFLGQREWAAAMFCVLYGLSNGILTIVKGTTPRELFGREHYGAIAGAIAAPSLIALAAGPLVIAAVIEKTSSAHTLLGILFLVSLFSFGCFVAAVSRRSVTGKPAEHIQSAN